MNLEKKINSWLCAEVIDRDTADRIRQFEENTNKIGVIFVLGALGGLALGIGIISIVASNWEFIPAWVKLTTDILILIALSFGINWADAFAKQWQKETFIIVYYLVFLASISLVGQVYQLGAPIYQGMILWTLGSAPLVLMGASRSLAIFWLVGVLTTYACIVEAFIGNLEPLYKKEATALFMFFPPFALLIISSLSFFKIAKPNFVAVFKPAAIIWVLAMGFVSQFIWYQKISDSEVLFWSPLIVMVFILVFTKLYNFEFIIQNTNLISILRVFLVMNSILICLPWIFQRPAFDLIGVGSHFILCGFLGWSALRMRHKRLFNWMAGLAGFRIVTVYFEVFGSLLETGFGLIATGVFILTFVLVFLKKFPKWEALIPNSGG
jgi:uncharacterized membrane protein